ncbi:unnamed protein product [Fraxinus pennsylvanica]|uniref:Uncharacterized protein n=1 Tax=Fraxinus pennsylvanica TaxID=56036 RepID=A0AAD2E6K6_9LAMI|nr:unnamed protein product [Fraxinus pennsylvanica]
MGTIGGEKVLTGWAIAKGMGMKISRTSELEKTMVEELEEEPFQPLISPSQSAVPGWMSSATHSLPRASIVAGPAHIHTPNSGMTSQAAGFGFQSQPDGSSIRPLFTHINEHE